MTIVIVLLVVLAVIGLACVGICGFGIFAARRTVEEAGKQLDKGFEAFGDIAAAAILQADAQIRLQQEPQVIDKIGTPITFTPGSTDTSTPTATGKFQIALSGPKGNATAHGEGRREGDSWKLAKLHVDFIDGSSIDIDPTQPVQIPLDGNPPGNPPGLPEIPIPNVPKPETPPTPTPPQP